ncbi:YybS family protein [Metabacillus sp. FJAT-52054]|uniref:YybS family protein n=1 Tax=Metabacillus sediminis TaxID=3117746 RepID=A0ABZ2NGN5_9BACI
MKRTKALTEGAIMLALFTVAVLITITVPLLGIITSFALPIPFIVYALRHDTRSSLLLFAASLPVVFITGSISALLAAAPTALTGIIMGTLYKKRGSAPAVIGGTFAFLVTILGGYVISVLFFQVNPLTEFKSIMTESMNMATSFMKTMGQPPKEEQMRLMRTQMEQFFTLMPTVAVMCSFFFSIITHAIASAILKRLKLEVKPLKPFREWKLPQSIAWYYLAVVLLSYIGFEKGSYASMAVSNVFFILMILLVIQGFSFLFYYAYVKGISKSVPITVVIISLFLSILLYPIQFLGIIDIGFRLREKITPKS